MACDTLILQLTMPGGLPAVTEGCHFLVLSIFTCCLLSDNHSGETPHAGNRLCLYSTPYFQSFLFTLIIFLLSEFAYSLRLNVKHSWAYLFI